MKFLLIRYFSLFIEKKYEIFIRIFHNAIIMNNIIKLKLIPQGWLCGRYASMGVSFGFMAIDVVWE